MIDSIQTFGDSFLFGSDLSDRLDKPDRGGYHSLLTWPALIAHDLNLDYECWAEGGRGNQAIAFKIFRHATIHSLNIINWTWIDRYDHHFEWYGWPETIRPIGDKLADFYYKELHQEFDDKIRNLSIILSAIAYLEDNDMPYIMTYMDKLMLDNSRGIENLRTSVRKKLKTFPNDQTFLEWSRANGYPESEGWHPLEQAHEAAAEYWLPIYQREINTHTATTKD
jgi:hypothetical protein